MNSRGQIDSSRVLSTTSNNTKRKSLALFKEIDEAMGEAFSQVDETQPGPVDVNFTGAVNAQVNSTIIIFMFFCYYGSKFIFCSI